MPARRKSKPGATAARSIIAACARSRRPCDGPARPRAALRRAVLDGEGSGEDSPFVYPLGRARPGAPVRQGPRPLPGPVQPRGTPSAAPRASSPARPSPWLKPEMDCIARRAHTTSLPVSPSPLV
jgi:hypothetical protein